MSFLFVWLLLGLGMMTLVMPWVASRYFIIVIFPAACLWVRHSQYVFKGHAHTILWVVVVFTILGAVSLAYADYRQASIYRRIAVDVSKRVPQGADRYFLGDSFVGYTVYLELVGWKPLFPSQPIPSGVLLLKNEYTAPSWWTLEELGSFEHIDTMVLP